MTPAAPATSPAPAGAAPRPAGGGGVIVVDAGAAYDKAAVASLFDVTERAVEKWRKKRAKFPRPFYVGRTPYWRGSALLSWMEGKQAEALAS